MSKDPRTPDHGSVVRLRLEVQVVRSRRMLPFPDARRPYWGAELGSDGWFRCALSPILMPIIKVSNAKA